jgi:hypothetical protein
MTRVVIVGEIFNADLSVGGGPVYPGRPGAPVDPGWGNRPPVDPGYGRPGWGPVDPGWGGGPPLHPGNRPPGSWGGEYPSQGPVWGYPDNSLPGTMPQGGTEVPPDVYPPPPVPEEIASQVIVSVYNPKTMTWTTKSYPPR